MKAITTEPMITHFDQRRRSPLFSLSLRLFIQLHPDRPDITGAGSAGQISFSLAEDPGDQQDRGDARKAPIRYGLRLGNCCPRTVTDPQPDQRITDQSEKRRKQHHLGTAPSRDRPRSPVFALSGIISCSCS